jgi:hypothetical protein
LWYMPQIRDSFKRFLDWHPFSICYELRNLQGRLLGDVHLREEPRLHVDSSGVDFWARGSFLKTANFWSKRFCYCFAVLCCLFPSKWHADHLFELLKGVLRGSKHPQVA